MIAATAVGDSWIVLDGSARSDWFLGFLVPEGDIDWCSSLFAGGCTARQRAGSGNKPSYGELIWRGRSRQAHTFWLILVDAPRLLPW